MTNELDRSQRLDKFMVPLVYTGNRYKITFIIKGVIEDDVTRLPHALRLLKGPNFNLQYADTIHRTMTPFPFQHYPR
jgi:hypothetical protein